MYEDSWDRDIYPLAARSRTYALISRTYEIITRTYDIAAGRGGGGPCSLWVFVDIGFIRKEIL